VTETGIAYLPYPVHASRPVPPWRGPHTACCLPAAGLVLLGAEEFTARQREEDAFSIIGRRIGDRETCPRCRLEPWEARLRWEDDPAEVAGLDFSAPRWAPWRGILRPELRALAALAARHPAEFQRLLRAEQDRTLTP
jgi:hypothetical protein